MPISDIARETVVTASPDTTVRDVVALMDEHDVGCIVLEEDGEPVGLVTDRKIALALADTPDVATHRVGAIMTADLITVHESDGVAEVTKTLADAGIRRTPVVDDDGELVGIVSTDDLAVLLTEEFENLEAVVEQQSPRF